MFLVIDLFIAGKVFSFIIVYSYLLIHSLQVKCFVYDCLFLCIDLFNIDKTMENLRNKHMVDLVALEKEFKKLVAQPSVAAKLAKVKLMLNRPIYVRFSILDLRKR